MAMTRLNSSTPVVPQVDVRFARDRTDYEQAFRLIYRLYRQRRYAQPHPDRLRYIWHLGMPGSRTIIAKTPDQRIVGTASYIPDGPSGLPMDCTFPQDLNTLRRQGKRIAEVMSLAIDAPREVSVWHLFYQLTRFLFQYSLWKQTDQWVVAVHPRHEAFYCRHLGFARFGDCRPYQSAEGNPAMPCRLELNEHSMSRSVRPSILRMYYEEPIPEHHFEHDDMSPADHAYFRKKIDQESSPSPAVIADNRIRRPA